MKNKLKNLGLAGLLTIYSLAGGFMLYKLFSEDDKKCLSNFEQKTEVKKDILSVVENKSEKSDSSLEKAITWTNEILEKSKLHNQALKNYTPITKEEIQADTNRFNMLNSGLKEYINKIYIIDKKDFFNQNVEAHQHDDSTLCLPKDFDDELITHESAHIRLTYLNKNKSELTKKWGEVANFEYHPEIALQLLNPEEIEDLFWEDKTRGPKNGMLEPYSSRTIHEDVANFVESLGYKKNPEQIKREIEKAKQLEERYSTKLKNLSRLEMELDCLIYPLYFADTTDSRYKQKLNLLKEYNFLTKEEHEKLSKNLGSLSYLLK